MSFLTDPMIRAGYKIQNYFTANARLKKWQTYFESPPQTAIPPAASIKPDDINVDDFVTKQTTALVVALLSHSHTELVNKAAPVATAIQVHMTTPRITRLIYDAVEEAGELDGMVSARHRAMITAGQFSSNALARCYAVALAELQSGSTHSTKSAFAQAVKLYGQSQAAKQLANNPKPTPAPAPKPSVPSNVHKKSPAKKAEDCGSYDR